MVGVKRARSNSPSPSQHLRKQVKLERDVNAEHDIKTQDASSGTLSVVTAPLTSKWTAINSGASLDHVRSPQRPEPVSGVGSDMGSEPEHHVDQHDLLDEIEMDADIVPTEETQREDDEDEDDDDYASEDEDEPYLGRQGKGYLAPVGKRIMATTGVKDESMLHILTTHSITKEEKELHFQNIVYARIDWSNKDHIMKINAWRGQIFGRAGDTVKDVSKWQPDEEVWLEIYYGMLSKYAQKYPLLKPTVKGVCDNFNHFFKGAVLKDKHGQELVSPHNERQPAAFSSKITRLCEKTKAKVDALAKGKSSGGEPYTPVITWTMINDLKKIKNTLEARLIGYGSINLKHDKLKLHGVNVKSGPFKQIKDFKTLVGNQESLTAAEQSALFAEYEDFFDKLDIPPPRGAPKPLGDQVNLSNDASGRNVQSSSPHASPGPTPKSSKDRSELEDRARSNTGDGAIDKKATGLATIKDSVGQTNMDLHETANTPEIAKTTVIVKETVTTEKKTAVKAQPVATERRATRASSASVVEKAFGSMSVQPTD